MLLGSPLVLLVCRACLKSVGKKGGRKRESIENQLDAMRAAAPEELGAEVEIVKTGCLDLCPEGGVAAGLARGAKVDPDATFVLKPRHEPAEALARLREARRAVK